MARRRERLGEPPTPEELLDWRDGRLPEAKRREVAEKMVAFPDAAQALADLEAFPDVQPAPGVRRVGEEEVDQGWEAFRARLEAKAAHPGEEISSSPPSAAPLAMPIPRRSREGADPSWRSGVWRVAAAVLLLVAGVVIGYSLRGPSEGRGTDSALNVAIARLEPRGAGGERALGRAATVPLERGSEGLTLVLSFLDPGTWEDYSVELRPQDGAPVWQARGLRPTEVGTFQFSVARSLLSAGYFEIHLHGYRGEERAPLAVYDLRLVQP